MNLEDKNVVVDLGEVWLLDSFRSYNFVFLRRC